MSIFVLIFMLLSSAFVRFLLKKLLACFLMRLKLTYNLHTVFYSRTLRSEHANACETVRQRVQSTCST